MRPRIRGEEYRTTLLCIDSCQNGNLQGRFFNPHMTEGKVFLSLTQLLQEMEQLLNGMEYPAAYQTIRTFSPPQEHSQGPPVPEQQTGQCGTFALRILFRQNASWQGSVTWLEGRQEQSFRSVLELILLLDSALTQPQIKVS